MTSLSGLGLVTMVAGNITIQNNSSLTDVTALNSLGGGIFTGTVSLTDNEVLLQADADALCNLLISQNCP
jgi:hypothetical protein